MELPESWLRDQAERLVEVPGVVAVMLGGSRARGEHSPDSDTDLGLYYRPPLDVVGLRVLAREVAGPDAELTEVGAWGPWVDGGGWLQVGGAAVDWLYRDVDRVRAAWEDARRGRYRFHAQVGHPLGVPDFAYAGEVALGVVLADPSGLLSRLQQETRRYPPALSEALVSGLWEADFLLAAARKAARRGDTAYLAGCLFRVVGVCVHALHGHAGRWLVNEKGAVRSAARLPGAPPGFAEEVGLLLGGLGTSPDQLRGAVEHAASLVATTVSATASDPSF
ncbi:MAG: nucleotidyltransferase domain-containing protein [Friedmanniella sp.]